MQRAPYLRDNPSYNLLRKKEYVERINTHTVRLHKSKRKGTHLDHSLGFPRARFCVDLVLEEPPSYSQIRDNDDLPAVGEMKKIKMKNAHLTSPFLTGKIGMYHIMTSGYGIGEWIIVKRERSRVKSSKTSRYIVDDDVYVLEVSSGKNKKYYKIFYVSVDLQWWIEGILKFP
jgi:hypothetical protein